MVPSGRNGVSMIGERHSDLAMHDDEAARQALALPLQQHLGEQQVRGRAADIDADGGELDVLLVPDVLRDRGALLVRHREVFVEEVELVHEELPGARASCPLCRS